MPTAEVSETYVGRASILRMQDMLDQENEELESLRWFLEQDDEDLENL